MKRRILPQSSPALLATVASLFLFALPAAAQSYTVLHPFETPLQNPRGLVQESDGNFYGTTTYGGASGNGTVFRITPTGAFTTLYSFAGSDGRSPRAGLMKGSDGNLYGTTDSGGASGRGTIFRITLAGALTTLYSFAGSDGAYPYAGVVQGTNGNFYGTTYRGGTFDYGTVFGISPAGAQTMLYIFAGGDGAYPQAALVRGTDGTYFGTTTAGGARGGGTVFKITSAGALTTIHSFAGNDGMSPFADLVQGTDGNLYGTTSQGGANSLGGVFKITPAGALTALHFFSGNDGRNPFGTLVQGTDGNFYGTTYQGGLNNYGTIFRITPEGTLTTLYSFTFSDGAYPYAGLVQGTDGNFYGTTDQGGTNGGGVVFRLTRPPPVVTGISPTSGPVSGGTVVTVSGTDFQPGAAVSFGGTAATGVTFSSATTIHAVSPVHAPGTLTVTVTNPDLQTGSLASAYTFSCSWTPTAPNGGPYCIGGSISLSTPTVPGANYFWTGPNAFASTVQNPTIAGAALANSGQYSVTVTLGGCPSDPGTTAVVVNPMLLTPTVSSSGPYWPGATIALSTPTISGATYAWTGPNDFTSALQNPRIQAVTTAATGVYFVTVMAGGCISPPGSTNVIVNPELPKWGGARMAYVHGAIAGTIWQSDVTIFNADPSRTATYSIAFLDARNPVDDSLGLTWYPLNVPPLGSTAFGSILSGFFGQTLGAYGALMIRGDLAPLAPVVTARTFNNGDPRKGTFGLSVPALPSTRGVSAQSSAAQQLLIGLRDDDSAYTNIALVNLIGTDWSHAHLTFFDAADASLGSLSVDVPPNGVLQLNKPLTSGAWLARPPLALYRVQVTVNPGGAVYPYATVIDQMSTDPIVVTPTEQPVNTYRVPGIVRLAGANNTVWRSRFTITNPSESGARKVHMVFTYAPCSTSGCGSAVSVGGDVTMNPGQTQSWDDFVKIWLTVKGGIPVDDSMSYQNSFLDVSPGDSNSDPLVVLGETYNDTPNGHVGLQVTGFTDLHGASKTGSSKRLLLTGLASNTDFRTNVAFFLTSGTSGYFNVRVLSDTGATLKTFGWNLTDSSPFKQFGDSELFGGVNKSDRMSIVVDSFDGSSPVAAYATIIDNTSGDATFVKAQPAP